jgi:Leucine Rich repeat
MDRGAGRLINAVRAPNLRKLSLSGNDLGNETVHAIAANPAFRKLENLSLSYNAAIDDDGAKALAESPHLGRLRGLSIFETSVSDSGLELLRKRFRNVFRG